MYIAQCFLYLAFNHYNEIQHNSKVFHPAQCVWGHFGAGHRLCNDKNLLCLWTLVKYYDLINHTSYHIIPHTSYHPIPHTTSCMDMQYNEIQYVLFDNLSIFIATITIIITTIWLLTTTIMFSQVVSSFIALRLWYFDTFRLSYFHFHTLNHTYTLKNT